MLYSYSYPQNHKLGKLNDYLVQFLTNIKDVQSTAVFKVEDFFHEDFVVILNRSNELHSKFKTFFDTYKKLSIKKKSSFHQLMLKSQNFTDYFTDITIDCRDLKREKIEELLGNQSFQNLISHLFKTTLKIFDINGHYKLIYNSMAHKVCPFCGLEVMHQSYREDYDHLAAKRHYPFVGIHPANLAPMCHSCNSKNKGEKDVLHNANGTRNRMIYPYSEKLDVKFDYTGSIIPQTDIKNQTGSWMINILPDNDVTKNWDKIFGIKKRYMEDYLEPNFEEWINDFITDCIEAGKDLSKQSIIKDELLLMSSGFKRKWYQHSNIIKAPLFEFLSSCDNNAFYNSISEKFNRLRLNTA